MTVVIALVYGGQAFFIGTYDIELAEVGRKSITRSKGLIFMKRLTRNNVVKFLSFLYDDLSGKFEIDNTEVHFKCSHYESPERAALEDTWNEIHIPIKPQTLIRDIDIKYMIEGLDQVWDIDWSVSGIMIRKDGLTVLCLVN